jgi:hypothetical protein
MRGPGTRLRVALLTGDFAIPDFVRVPLVVAMTQSIVCNKTRCKDRRRRFGDGELLNGARPPTLRRYRLCRPSPTFGS